MARNALNTLHRYRTALAALAIIVFAGLTLGVIWFIRQAQQPLAPTAPVSVPQAAENVCSLTFTVNNECVSMTPSGEGQPGEDLTFTCVGLAGTDTYRFEYKTSSGEAWQTLVSTDDTSSSVTVGDYLSVRCIPCAGTLCATDASVADNCTYTVMSEATPSPSPSPSPTPSPSPSVSPSPSPSPTPGVTPTPSPSPSPTPKAPQCNSECVNNADCPSDLVCSSGRCRNEECTGESDCTCSPHEDSPDTGFYVQKFNDLDGDGSKDDGEPGLDWEFEWQKNDDGNWRQYITYADRDGRGGNVANLEPNDKIEIREKAKSGWVATTPTNKTLIMEKEKTKSAQFGNRQPVSSAPPATATPQPQLPQSGSTAQTVALLSLGVLAIGLGVYRFTLKRP